MPDRALIRLNISHDYDAPAEPPVRLQAADGLVVRRLAGRHVVILPEWLDQPTRVSLTLFWEDLNFCAVTKGYDWSSVPVIALDPDEESVVFGEATVLRQEARRPGDRRIMQLDIDLKDDAARDIRVGFQAIAAHWLYHVTGRGLRDDLQIVDGQDGPPFDDLGPETLPNGMPARALRSPHALPLRARPQQRFTLQYPGQFGPVVLVPALPAAGPTLRPLSGSRTTAGLQADIYVTLN